MGPAPVGVQDYVGVLGGAGAGGGALGPRDGQGLLLLLATHILGEDDGRQGYQQKGQLYLQERLFISKKLFYGSYDIQGSRI